MLLILYAAHLVKVIEPLLNLGRARMRGPHIFVYLSIFGVCMILGLWSGYQVGSNLASAFLPRKTPVNSPLSIPATGQKNVLVIGVDRFDGPTPTLASIWLLSYFPEIPQLTLIPIYPSIVQEPILEKPLLKNGFHMEANDDQPVGIFEWLQDKQVWWSGYVLMDRIMMTEIVNVYGGIDVEGRHMDGIAALDWMSKLEDDSQQANYSQTIFLRSLCAKASERGITIQFDKLLDMFPQHAQSDLDLSLAIREWRNLVSAETPLVCEFPLYAVKDREE